MTRPTSILRWICVLAGAMLAAILVGFPIHWIVMLIQLRDRFFGSPHGSFITTADGRTNLAAIPPEVLERLGVAFFAPFTIVAVGALIAPRYRFCTAVTLTVVFIVFIIMAHIVMASSGLHFAAGWFQMALTYILSVAGLGCGIYASRNESDTTTPLPEVTAPVDPAPFKFACPHCGQHISTTADTVGAEGACPTCKNAIIVPPAPIA